MVRPYDAAVRNRLALAFLLLAAVPAGAAERTPSFPKRTAYGEARATLIGLGWAPVKLPDADTCDEGDERCQGRPEMLSCSGTGRANCAFTWKKGDSLVQINTYGETNPMIDNVRCRAGCR